MADQAVPSDSGLYMGDKYSVQPVDGIAYIGCERERIRRVAETGDPESRTFEVTYAGIQSPRWGLSCVGATDASGNLETGTYYLVATFYSTKYNVESDPGPVSTVTLSGTQNEICVDGANFLSPPENDLEPTSVDRIRIYRTLSTGDVDFTTDDDGYGYAAQSIIVNEGIGLFYLAADISIDSFTNLTVWAAATSYSKDDKVEAVVGAFTNKYLALKANDSVGPAITDDIAANPDWWLLTGQDPVYLRDQDSVIGNTANLLSIRRGVPPDVWSVRMFEGRLWGTGQKDYQLKVDVTNGSRVVTASSTAVTPPIGSEEESLRVVPSGITNREFLVQDDGRRYAVSHWINDKTFWLSESYAGGTATDVKCTLRSTNGAVYMSELDSQGIAGAPLADAWPANNLVIFDPEDGQGTEALEIGRGVLYCFKENGWGWTSSFQNQFTTVERVAVRTLGNRGIARGLKGEVFFVSDDGIRMIVDPGPSRLISDPVRHLWEPVATRPTVAPWNKSELKRSVLVYHPRLQWLIMIGPAGGVYNNLMLVWDQRLAEQNQSAGWSILFPWIDNDATTGEGTLVYPDITDAFVLDDHGNQKIVVAGRMLMDTDDDRVLDADGDHAGRHWLLDPITGRVYQDQIPKDKAFGWTGAEKPDWAVATPSTFDPQNHRIVWRFDPPPVAAKDGEQVQINTVQVRTDNKVTGKANVKLWLTVQNEKGAEKLVFASARKSKVDQYLHTFRPHRNQGRFVRSVLGGEVGTANDETIIRSVSMDITTRGQGGRE